MTPDEYTIQELMLDVGDGHRLHVHDWGHKDAKTPIIFLHGGPGGSTQNKHRQLFDGSTQRVIFFDQRGSGKSLPYGSLEHNTTPELVEDIEKIAEQLKLHQFILMGGSWGSALALFYALEHPKRVKGMVLNGIWTCSTVENDWVDKGGFRTFFPDVWARYVASAPAKYADDPSKYHFARILGPDEAAAKASAYEYEKLEGSAISLDDRFLPEDFESFDPFGVRIEVYYLVNQCFMPDRYILDNAHKLTMPIWLIQGRYDMVCPPHTAHELSKALPNGKLIWTTSGHKAERESWNVQRTILAHLTEER